MDSVYLKHTTINYFSVLQTLEIEISPKAYLKHTSYLEYRIIFEVCSVMEQWHSGQGAGLPNQRSQVQNHKLTEKLCQLSSFKGQSNSLSNSRRHSANADVIADVESKINVSRRHFFADVIFSTTSQKFKTIKIKPEKSPSIPKQIRAYYILQGILRIISNIYALRFIFSKL